MLKPATPNKPKAVAPRELRSDVSTVDARHISANGCYTEAEFQRLTGLGKTAIRAARRRGLIVRRVGRNNFILGRDWHDFLQNKADIVQ